MGLQEIEMNKQIESGYSESISQNLLRNSWWTKGLTHWNKLCGEVAITEDEHGWMNVMIDSRESAQIQQKVVLRENHCYFIMFDIKVTRYISGLFGAQLSGKILSGNTNFGVQRQTKNRGYETIFGVVRTGSFPSPEYTLSVGSIGQANGAGSIRKLSVYDLTAIYGSGNEPTGKAFFDTLPDTQDECGIASTNRQLFATLDTKINKLTGKAVGASDREAHVAFLEEMNKKAKLLGMADTNFENMHGFKVDGQISTAKDFMKLGLQILGCDELMRVWGAEEYIVSIQGGNSREITIRTTLKNAFLEEKYMLLGGKTGTIGREILDVITLTADQSGDLYLAVVMGASGRTGENDRFEGVHQLITAYKQQSLGKDNSEETLKAASGMVLRVPNGHPLYYTNHFPTSTFGIHETKSVIPAAMPKLMTALVLIENISNLNETGIILGSDITGGSGPKMFEGDQLSFRDALYLLLLASSNTAAKFISREVGHRIIQTRGYSS